MGLKPALRRCSALYCRTGWADANMDDCSQPKRDIRIKRTGCFAASAKETRRFPKTGHSAILFERGCASRRIALIPLGKTVRVKKSSLSPDIAKLL